MIKAAAMRRSARFQPPACHEGLQLRISKVSITHQSIICIASVRREFADGGGVCPGVIRMPQSDPAFPAV